MAVPLFVTRTEATERRIPEEPRRKGIKYAEPLGTHPRLTDAIHAEVAKQRTLTVDDAVSAALFEARLTQVQCPSAKDGEET